jgi:hypothetical protein
LFLFPPTPDDHLQPCEIGYYKLQCCRFHSCFRSRVTGNVYEEKAQNETHFLSHSIRNFLRKKVAKISRETLPEESDCPIWSPCWKKFVSKHVFPLLQNYAFKNNHSLPRVHPF